MTEPATRRPETMLPAVDDDTLASLVSQAKLATLGMLLAGVTHEINTPLGAINSNHDVLRRALNKLQDILEDEVVTPDELEEVRRIVRAVDAILRVNDIAVERMTGLVASLRSFGRLDRAPVDWADLHEGIDSTLSILAHELREIAVERQYGSLPPVRCHPDQINQVWMNLIVNAVHAMPDGGALEIRTSNQDEEVRVAISDTGCGIESEVLGHIFEPGFTTKQGRIGMGLGLLISRRIVEYHRGAISVESEPGAGTTFTVTLPVTGL
jgi:two-component system, NtrC family, sensor kinase